MLYTNRAQFLLALLLGLFAAAFAGAQQLKSSIDSAAEKPVKEGLQATRFVDQASIERSAESIIYALRGRPEETVQEKVPEVVEEPMPYIVAIVLSGSKRRVIVEGEAGENLSLTEGDVWRAWTVGRIEAARVEFLKSGESSTYSVFAIGEEEALAQTP